MEGWIDEDYSSAMHLMMDRLGKMDLLAFIIVFVSN